MLQKKKLSKDVLIEEAGGFVRICYLEIDGSKSNELFLSEKEAKNLFKFLESFDYSNIKRIAKLR